MRGKGLSYQTAGGFLPQQCKNSPATTKALAAPLAPVLLAVHGTKWHVSHSLPTGLGRTAGGKAPFISSDWFQGLYRGKSQSLEMQREKDRSIPSLAAELPARGNEHSGSFCSKHGEGETWVLSSLFLKLPVLSIFQARKGYLSWQPWKSSTIWCLCVCRGSTEGFSVTDEICSPSNTPVKVILPLESQAIRFLSKRCLIPGN